MTQARDLGNIGDTIAGVSNANIDSGTLFVDAINNSVGINTTSPGTYGQFTVVRNVNDSTSGISVFNSNTGSSTRSQIQIGNDSAATAAFLGINSSTNTTGYGGANALILHQGLAAPIVFNTSAVERMRLDASGRLTLPNQPSFYATHSNNSTSTGTVVWGNVIYNIGNNYNSTNGRFTAPVAGTYFFRAQTLIQNAPSGEVRIALYKNDAGYGGSRFITQKPANAWFSIVVHGHMYLNANEWATVYFGQNPTTIYSDSDFNSFSGHLVG